MGKITFYSELVLAHYSTTERIGQRLKYCLDTDTLPYIAEEDWYTWVFILVELMYKKLATKYKFGLNSKSHNVVPIFSYLTWPHHKYFQREFAEFMSQRLGVPMETLSKDKRVRAFLALDFGNLKYLNDYTDFLKKVSIDFVRRFAQVTYDYLVYAGIE